MMCFKMLIKEKAVYIFVFIAPNIYIVWAKSFGKHSLDMESSKCFTFISFNFSYFLKEVL